MRFKTQNGNYLIFSEAHGGHAVYYSPREGWVEGGFPGKILKVLKNGQKEFNWAKETWGQGQPSFPLSEEDIRLLQKTAPFLRGLKKIAIKNPKKESKILSESEFFKGDGLLLSRAIGITYRKIHQGTNSWSLFNIERRNILSPGGKKLIINLGTRDGADTNITTVGLIPISKKEWEEIAGRRWREDSEFAWFRGCKRRYLLSPESFDEGRVVSSKISAQRAGYTSFAPVEGINFSLNGDLISFPRKRREYPVREMSPSNIELLKRNNFHIYYVYESGGGGKVFARKGKPFLVKKYFLDQGEILVRKNKSSRISSIFGEDVPKGWDVYDGDIVTIIDNEEIKKIPHWEEYDEGRGNFRYRNSYSGYLLGDVLKK